CTVSAVSGHPLYCVCSLWSSPVLCPQSLVIPCTVSAVSGHPLYCVRSLWSSPVLCLQSLVISCTVLWSSPVPVLWSGASYGAKNTVYSKPNAVINCHRPYGKSNLSRI
ncbi:unnamed protein product, partial [Staurois parvus]